MRIPFLALVRGDVRERVRRRSFLATLAAALYLGYAAIAGNVVMRLDEYRGIYNSAWIGTLISLSTSLFVSLIGFYVIKNSIERDRMTGVGQILAATPLGRHTYLVSKWLSNFAVLATIVAIQLVAAFVMQLIKGEASVDILVLAAPSVLLTLPAMLFIAAVAVFFESARWLRGGFGNVLYFFTWAPFIILPMEAHLHWFDLFGMSTIETEIKNALALQSHTYKGGFSLNAGPAEQVDQLKTFVWNGTRWTGTLLLQRAAWIGYAIVPLLLAALFFDRFDAPASRARAAKAGARQGRGWMAAALHAVPAWSPSSRLGRLVVAELKLMFQGVAWWWFTAALGLVVLSLALPLDAVQNYVLPIAWLWPVLLWSTLGVREDRFGTSQMLFSAPNFVRLQFAALAIAGVICSIALGSGALLRFVLAGDPGALVSFAGGALFVPSLAICLAVWSKTSRAFEALYTVLWYIGPMNRVPSLDFTGASAVTRGGGYGFVYVALGLALLAAGYAGRLRQSTV